VSKADQVQCSKKSGLHAYQINVKAKLSGGSIYQTETLIDAPDKDMKGGSSSARLL
jgi:hypothetical protein